MQLNTRFLPDVRRYVEEIGEQRPELAPYLREATIVWYGSSAFFDEYHADLVRDLLVLVPGEILHQFVAAHGDSVVVDNHEYSPPMFMRIKSYEWLEKDFAARHPIAVWLYDHSLVVQENPERQFSEICSAQRECFLRSIPAMIERKYLELRSERHGIRTSFGEGNELGLLVVKTTVAKLAVEIAFLAEGKPYPWKKWLFWAARREVECAPVVLRAAGVFMAEADRVCAVPLSDELVAAVGEILRGRGDVPDDLLTSWWLHLP